MAELHSKGGRDAKKTSSSSFRTFFDISPKKLREEKKNLGDLYTESGQTLQGSFSAVSTPLIVRVASFFSSLRDPKDLHTFTPLRT